MYWLIETDKQLEFLTNSSFKEVFIEVIPNNYTIHPAKNGVCLVYIRPIESDKGYVIGIDHSETLSVTKSNLNDWLNKLDVIYCRDKKETLHYLPLKALYDIGFISNTYIPTKTNAIFRS